MARDQRVLHVARIVCVALERVGDLASAIADLTPATPPSPPSPAVRAELDLLAGLALDGLAAVRTALAEGDVSDAPDNEERAREARRVLARLVAAATSCPDQARPAEIVLLGRHLERTVDNAKEIARRLPFLATGAAAGRLRPGAQKSSESSAPQSGQRMTTTTSVAGACRRRVG